LKSASIEAGLLVSGAPHPAALWSLDRRVCVFNPLASELLGYSEREISYHPDLYIDRIHPDDRSVFLSAWQKLRNGEKSASCRYRFTPKHGVESRAIRENALLFDASERDAPAVLTLYSEERVEGEKITEAHQLRSLLRGVSHEIGNNLQAISGELELLKWSGMLPAENAAVMSSAIMQIRALTGDLEDYFSSLPAKTETSDLAALVAKAIHDCEEKTQANGIRSQVTVAGPLPPVALDRRFAKILRDLIEFSCALLGGGGELKIEAARCRRGERPFIGLNIISCCPNALAIEEDRVFRPFINVGGYRPGLRVAVAQRLLRRQSVEIAFRKEQPNRAVFSVLIPVADSAA
jgi:nitrogen-specific signal transduction histidine kinase